jgi:transcriptional regulator with XRE-family HTH domain
MDPRSPWPTLLVVIETARATMTRSMTSEPRPPSPFGQQLREWRQRRGLSQLELATQAGTTSRHLSFLETGRSRPGRDIVLRLASALEVPLGERNALLGAAGLSPEFPLHALDDEAMRPVAVVLDKVLRGHAPYPAWVYARGMQVLAANTAAEAMLPGLTRMSQEAIVDMWFAPGAFRDLVENWPEVILAGLESLRREARRAADPRVLALLRRAEAHAHDIPVPQGASPHSPVICPRFRIGGRTVRTIATVMRFDTAVEVTASELRIELLFPADDESDEFFRSLAAQ